MYLDSESLSVDDLWGKLDSKGGFVILFEGGFYESKHDAWFPNAWVMKEVLESPTMMYLKR